MNPVSCVDRTNDFMSQLNRFNAGGVNQNQAAQNQPVAATSSTYSPQMIQFNAVSVGIGEQIHATSSKVKELGDLSRGKGIFNDKTSQIQYLQNATKADIDDISRRITELESLAHQSGSGHLQSHCHTLVNSLKTRVMSLTNDFKNVLELRTRTLEQQQKRANIYRPQAAKIGNVFNATSSSYNAASSSYGGGDEMSDMLDPESQQMTAQSVEHTNARGQAIKKVNTMIADIATMFQKMTAMVAEQHEQLERIDGNINVSIDNVDKGQKHLLKYFNSMSNNRWLIIKVFAILIAFIVFFILFLA